MSNPFEDHGIYNVSPSQCAQYVSTPALWLMERVFKKRVPASAAMHAGNAAEAGVVPGLMDPDLPQQVCIDFALAEFRKLTALSTDPQKDFYIDALPKMVTLAVDHLRPYGKPTGLQGQVEYRVEELSVPFKGVYDIRWEHSGILTDLKTTKQMPSEIKLAHARQVSMYKHCISDNLDARVTYVTGKRVETYAVENSRAHLNALVKVALSMQKFLAISKDPRELAGYVVPDYEHWKWNNATARAHAFDVWGF